MKTLYLLLLFSPVICFSQDFELKPPNVEELKSVSSSGDEVYQYLLKNYKEVSEKFEIKNYDFPDYNICAFKQKFEHGITYSEEQCREAGGLVSILTLNKKTKKESITKWVELIYTISPMDIEHGWNPDKTKFSPIDNGAGCYFEIIRKENNIVIEMYCGC